MLIRLMMFFAVSNVQMVKALQAPDISNDLQMHNSFLTMSELIETEGTGTIVTIGSDVNCQFDTAVDSLQDAIDSGADEIRVATNGNYVENITISDQSVIIRGGFADCSQASLNNQIYTEFATIDGNANPQPVITINQHTLHSIVRFENLRITGGSSSLPAWGGGISLFEADVELQMLRVIIENNTANVGAGLAVDSSNVTGGNNIFGQDIIIKNNESTTNNTALGGGGIYCFRGNHITLTGMSVINNNLAFRGGGVFLTSSCELNMYSEQYPQALAIISGIYGNKSSYPGGGVYLGSSTSLNMYGQQMCSGEMCMGDNKIPIHLSANDSAQNISLQEDGGGVYMSTNASFYGNGLIMDGNRASGNGGAIYITNSATATIERISKNCWHKDRCNLIIANHSGSSIGIGGAFYVDGGALNLHGTYLEENRADFATVVNATGETAVVNIESSVFDDNGDAGSGSDFSDTYLIRSALGADVNIRHSTFADNHPTSAVFDVDPALNSALQLSSSIVHDSGGGNIFSPAAGIIQVNCLIAHENSSFSGANVAVADPDFLDRLAGDFHLDMSSPAIDKCPPGTPLINDLDADYEPRGWDDPQNSNFFGPFDAGADESYLNDIIFANNFD